MRNMYYVDMHCHPATKPYSWSLNSRKNEKASIWYHDAPGVCDRIWNKIAGLTKFTQSDFTSLTNGKIKVISACLNPIERNMFIPRKKFKLKGTRLIKFIVEVSEEYITEVRKKNRNYFKDLKDEYDFYKSEEASQDPASPNQLKLTRNFSEIKKNLNDPDKSIISVFFSIEGCHVFNNGGLSNSLKTKKEIEARIQKVKKWKHPPLYVSIAHHMNNDLCGHAKSLPSLMFKLIDQTANMNKGFMGFGEDVLHKLLAKDPRRIYIDIKHMSVKSRLRYYEILEEKYKDDEIPIIVSHGAVNGLASIEAIKGVEFNTEDINIYDDEIIRIHCSAGFLGIQLDERRLTSDEQKRPGRWRLGRTKRLELHSKFVWDQICYIAGLLDNKGLFAWGTATLGSDNDGLVDALNGYWTSDDIKILENNLVRHAHEYFKFHSHELTQAKNVQPAPPQANPEDQSRANAQEVIDLFMRGNALRFLEKFYV